ncbi:MAG: ParA family protein [Leptospiraceae bacterium]|nr:ParA family protein [Leptospiraceae bacterium]MCP5513014.1 ParA family protein [Leptospiraceae bacterium]
MGKIIAISNQKGGVGKTTTSINLSSNLASMGKKILVVDIDPQGNAGSGLGIDVNQIQKTTYEVLLKEISIRESIIKTDYENLFILPANINLSGAEIDLANVERKEFALKDAIQSIKNDFDYVLIDCPPSLGLLTLNALSSADSVIITLQTEYFALEGLSQLMKIISLVQENLNSGLELEGVLLTMYDKRTNLANQVASDVRQYFQEKVFEAMIPRNIKLGEAPSFGKPINVYDTDGIGAKSYLAFAEEFIKKNQ